MIKHKVMKLNSKVPLDVPLAKEKTYSDNLALATRNTGRLMLFAGDQKTEHLNNDYYGEGIAKEDNNPEHLFRIASKARIGVFATQLGLISRYGMDYKDIPYLIKLNSKSNLVKISQNDPLSGGWFSVAQVEEFRKISKLKVVGVGYTVYLGSEFEGEMLKEAAQAVLEAHGYGMIAVLWMYPRGKAVLDEKDPHLIAGAAGVAATLGADFVKVNAPKKEGVASAEALKEAVEAAGRTKLICAGGSSTDVAKFLQGLYDQIHIGGAFGNATGRNIHQKPLEEAIRFCNAISVLTFDNKSAQEALKVYHGNK
jgi:fructose-bisphosphate aldolase / 6-deoxy-5-ketofructose 1-phosphate synthase